MVNREVCVTDTEAKRMVCYFLPGAAAVAPSGSSSFPTALESGIRRVPPLSFFVPHIGRHGEKHSALA